MLKKGQICFSKAGHDKGGAFIILHSDDTYAYIADGKLRTLEKPKKKKRIHIQISNEVNSEIENMLENELYINDSRLDSEIESVLYVGDICPQYTNV